SEEFAIGIREGCVSLPEPKLGDWFKYVYADMPEYLAAQREEYLAYESSFSDADTDASAPQEATVIETERVL
ncbi:MAG: hypothetical protein WAS07_06795, partial [Micropruina sp.]